MSRDQICSRLVHDFMDDVMVDTDARKLPTYLMGAMEEASVGQRPSMCDEAERVSDIARKWALKMMREMGLEDVPFVSKDSVEEFIRKAIEMDRGETRQEMPT